MGNRRIAVASMGNYFQFSNIRIRRRLFANIHRSIISGSLLITTLPQPIPGTTKISFGRYALRQRYEGERINIKKNGFTIYSTAKDSVFFSYFNDEYLHRLKQMCEKLNIDIALTIKGYHVICVCSGMRDLFVIEGADAKKHEHDAWQDIHTLLYLRMMTYPFTIWDKLGYCD